MSDTLFQGSWLTWLIIGIVLGWLLELLVDYLFWNRRYSDVEAEARAEAAAAQQKASRLQADLEQARRTQASLEAQVDELRTQQELVNRRIGLVALAAGTTAALGRALANDDEEAIRQQITALDTQVAGAEAATRSLAVPQSVLAAQPSAPTPSEAELVELQAALADQASEAGRTVYHAELVAAGSGLVGNLGRALLRGDKRAIQAQIDLLERALATQGDALKEAAQARVALEDANNRVALARAAQASLQRQVDQTAAALRSATSPTPAIRQAPAQAVPPPAPAASASTAIQPEVPALALLLSGRPTPDLDATRLQALMVEVERAREVHGQDLLQMIDGIDAGLEIQLYAAGLTSYQALVHAGARKVAAATGVDMQIGAGWVAQAEQIHHGTRPGRNRLTVLQGLSPAIQGKLYAAGFTTYTDLADASEEQVLEAAGKDSTAQAPIWIFQAKLLAGVPEYQLPHHDADQVKREHAL